MQRIRLAIVFAATITIISESPSPSHHSRYHHHHHDRHRHRHRHRNYHHHHHRRHCTVSIIIAATQSSSSCLSRRLLPASSSSYLSTTARVLATILALLSEATAEVQPRLPRGLPGALGTYHEGGLRAWAVGSEQPKPIEALYFFFPQILHLNRAEPKPPPVWIRLLQELQNPKP